MEIRDEEQESSGTMSCTMLGRFWYHSLKSSTWERNHDATPPKGVYKLIWAGVYVRLCTCIVCCLATNLLLDPRAAFFQGSGRSVLYLVTEFSTTMDVSNISANSSVVSVPGGNETLESRHLCDLTQGFSFILQTILGVLAFSTLLSESSLGSSPGDPLLQEQWITA